MSTAIHPHAAALLPAVRVRRDVARRDRELDLDVQRIERLWGAAPLSPRACGPVGRIGMVREYDAILEFAGGDMASFGAAFRDAAAFRSLAFRWRVFVLPHSAENLNLPLSAWDTVHVAGPAICGEWDEARACAEALLMAAELEQELSPPEVNARYWGKGTVDALLIQLLSGAMSLATRYTPVNPVAPAYRSLLEHWRTDDEALFREIMQAAAQFHLECSGDGTDQVRYEFESSFAQIFPLELLLIQALRRRDGLPDFGTGHALVDAPWAMLRDLPPAPHPPLVARVAERLGRDFPSYR